MGVLDTVLGVFRRGEVITLPTPPATCTAHDAITTLNAELRAARPDEIRRDSSRQYLEAVIRRDQLPRFESMLAEVFGEPCKPFGVRARFAHDLADRVAAMGGVLKRQCLYLRRFADDRIGYAALWPWEDPDLLTLKLGFFDEPLPHGH